MLMLNLTVDININFTSLFCFENTHDGREQFGKEISHLRTNQTASSKIFTLINLSLIGSHLDDFNIVCFQ